jgi:iron complex outermembrane receptor protein
MSRTLLRDAIRRALFAGAIAAVALPLHAQEVADATGDEAPAATAAPATLDRITVTGSRISRAVDVETVQPVTVLTRQDMERSGVQSVADVLQNLVVMGSPAISRADALSSGEAVGGSYVDIRNLGAARTLVLVNGQRLGVTTGGLADVSQIPTSAVERIEVLKDGGSANYGSDAIAGVVNIITRRNMEGAEANVYFGQFDEGDGGKQTYDATFGLTSDLGWRRRCCMRRKIRCGRRTGNIAPAATGRCIRWMAAVASARRACCFTKAGAGRFATVATRPTSTTSGPTSAPPTVPTPTRR